MLCGKKEASKSSPISIIIRPRSYDTPSKYGINRGRISKLSVRLDGRVVIGYDRDWYKQPSTQAEKAVLWIILNSYN